MPAQTNRFVVVTGANKGIGFAIVRNLALSYPASSCNNGPVLIYLTARNEERGHVALEELYSDPALVKAKALRKNGGLAEIEFRQLDITEPASITSFASFLKERHPAGIDILINNAGVATDGFHSEQVKQTLACNYYGTLQMTQTILPLLRQHGRIVNVCSMMGRLNKYSDQITQAFRTAAYEQSVKESNGHSSEGAAAGVTKLMQSFQDSVDRGTHEKDGWPPATAYSVSKAGAIGMTIAIGRHEAKVNQQKNILINACCPGYVSTDMTKHRGHKTIDDGAKLPVHLALGDYSGVTGEFWERNQVRDW